MQVLQCPLLIQHNVESEYRSHYLDITEHYKTSQVDAHLAEPNAGNGICRVTESEVLLKMS